MLTKPTEIFTCFQLHLLVGCLVLSGGFAQEPSGPPPSVADVATGEVARRQQLVKTSQQFIEAGTVAQSDGRYGEAMDNFLHAFELLPDSPATTATRRLVFRRYQAATVQFAQQMIDEARWGEAEQALTAALKLGSEAGMPSSSLDPGLKRMLANLNDSEYYVKAVGPKHMARVQKVKGLLILAQGALDYGKYDQAQRAYEEVLSIDRYNSAARRGMENLERHKLNYYDVARDQTRATNLRQIAEGWEMPVPRNLDAGRFSIPEEDTVNGRRVELEEKLRTITIPSIEFNQASLSQVLELLQQRSVELDFAEQDVLKRGINIILDSAVNGDQTLSLRLSNVPLGVALKYVTQQVGASYRVDNFAIKVVSLAEASQRVLETRTWTVPPGFLSRDSLGKDVEIDIDPFAQRDPNEGLAGSVLVKRKSAKEYLMENGIEFGDGAVANYNPATNTLLVRNTPNQLNVIDNLVQSVREGINKMVEVGIRMIRITQQEAQQRKIDWLLGQTNLGSTPRVFFGGGTDGNDAIPTAAANYPFVYPGVGVPVGVYPVTGGLRSGDFKTLQTLEDVIARANPETATALSEAPATFSVAGVFTDPTYQATLRMVSQLTGKDTLCDTKVLVQPGQRAKLELIREFIYPTEYDPPEIPNNFGVSGSGNVLLINPADVTPATPATPTAFEMRPLGKVIEVEPVVSGDNTTITVNVVVDFSEFLGFINYGIPIRDSINPDINGVAPVVTPNEILMPVFEAVKETTNVTVWDGQTIAIGGMIGHSVSDTEDKIPFLGDLPALGKAFRSSTEDHLKTGVVIFLTVKLVDPAGQPINQEAEQYTANEFPPRSNLPPVQPNIPFIPPSTPYQK